MGSVYRGERADGAFAKPVVRSSSYCSTPATCARGSHPRTTHPRGVQPSEHRQSSGCRQRRQRRALSGDGICRRPPYNGLRAPTISWSIRARIALFLKILDAVQTAHSHLIVHRDIKPSNVLVDAHGEPKLLDFGIAKLLGEGAPAATRTGLGSADTEVRASPEQVRGEPDRYGFGHLLAWCAALRTGHRRAAISHPGYATYCSRTRRVRGNRSRRGRARIRAYAAAAAARAIWMPSSSRRWRNRHASAMPRARCLRAICSAGSTARKCRPMNRPSWNAHSASCAGTALAHRWSPPRRWP